MGYQSEEMGKSRLKYLKLLSRQYPNINAACTEIINLQAILNLPKGTEHFVSDVHGQYEAFNHVLKNASGVFKNYIDEIFGSTLMEEDKKNLATLIYYPELRIDIIKRKNIDMNDWYRINLFRLIQICKRVSSKYTRSKVRKALPSEFAYIIEELIHEDGERIHKHEYYNEIINTIVRLNRAHEFIIVISKVIQRLAIDHLHVIGDIYDRGMGADKIMEVIVNYHSVDIQWGNHDISWMGAASGSEACICNVIRISARYNNLHTIEDGYGINLVPLATFAMEMYKDDKCERFDIRNDNEKISDKESELISKMQKAISVIQFKIEAQTIKRNPEFDMDNSIFIDKMNFENNTVNIDGIEYKLIDTDLPTVDPQNPFELSAEEKQVIEKIKHSFLNSNKLQEHARFLFNKGGMYTIYNSNLLFHGCVPLNFDGTLKNVTIKGEKYSGRKLLDKLEIIARKGYFASWNSKEKQIGLDYLWYLWCGPNSPLYGKEKMTTFERYFVDEESLYEEIKNPYYDLRNDENMCRNILCEFGLNPETSRIINGHVPVKVSKGESPVKANGKLLVIDGGFAKAYQSVTGIAGYTLIYNSQGLVLTSHEPFSSIEEAVENEKDIISSTIFLERNAIRKKVETTDIGNEINARIKDLEGLVNSYNSGIIKESIEQHLDNEIW